MPAISNAASSSSTHCRTSRGAMSNPRTETNVTTSRARRRRWRARVCHWPSDRADRVAKGPQLCLPTPQRESISPQIVRPLRIARRPRHERRSRETRNGVVSWLSCSRSSRSTPVTYRSGARRPQNHRLPASLPHRLNALLACTSRGSIEDAVPEAVVNLRPPENTLPSLRFGNGMCRDSSAKPGVSCARDDHDAAGIVSAERSARRRTLYAVLENTSCRADVRFGLVSIELKLADASASTTRPVSGITSISP